RHFPVRAGRPRRNDAPPPARGGRAGWDLVQTPRIAGDQRRGGHVLLPRLVVVGDVQAPEHADRFAAVIGHGGGHGRVDVAVAGFFVRAVVAHHGVGVVHRRSLHGHGPHLVQRHGFTETDRLSPGIGTTRTRLRIGGVAGLCGP